MLIMVEGVDCSGKTWVAQQLLKKLRGETFLLKHGNRPKTGSHEEIEAIKNTYVDMLGIYQQFSHAVPPVNFIFDRYFQSELAYSQVKRDYEAMRDPWYNSFERQVKEENHILLYVQPSLEIIEARLRLRGDDYVNLEDIKALLGVYDNIIQNTSLATITIINDDLSNIDGIIQTITGLN